MHVPVYMRCIEVCGAVWGCNELRVRETEGAEGGGVRVRISHVHKSGDRINTAPVVTVQMMQFPLQIRYTQKKDVAFNSHTRFNLQTAGIGCLVSCIAGVCRVHLPEQPRRAWA